MRGVLTWCIPIEAGLKPLVSAVGRLEIGDGRWPLDFIPTEVVFTIMFMFWSSCFRDSGV